MRKEGNAKKEGQKPSERSWSYRRESYREEKARNGKAIRPKKEIGGCNPRKKAKVHGRGGGPGVERMM